MNLARRCYGRASRDVIEDAVTDEPTPTSDGSLARLLNALERHVRVVAASAQWRRRQVLHLEATTAVSGRTGRRPVAGYVRGEAVGDGRSAGPLARVPAHVI